VDGWSADHGKKIKLYLDVDMVASPNGGYFVHGGKGSDEEEAGPAGSATIALVVADQLTKTGVARSLSSSSGTTIAVCRGWHPGRRRIER
jgi:aminopeptidase S